MILALLLDEKRAPDAIHLYDSYQERFASILLEAECNIVLQRQKLDAKARILLVQDLNLLLDGITLRQVDKRIVSVLTERKELSECRNLDALHLATALDFSRQMDSPLPVATFDNRMHDLCRLVGLPAINTTKEL